MIEKIAVLGNVTIDFIADEISKQTGSQVFRSGYGQYIFDIMNPESGLYSFSPELTILFADGNTLLAGKTAEEAAGDIAELYRTFAENSPGYFVVCSVIVTPELNAVQNLNTESNTKKDQHEINLTLNRLAAENDRFFVLDFASIAEKYGTLSIYDDTLWFLGNIRLNRLGNEKLAEELVCLINAILGKTKKCLVLDLDNTLWGGVIGEDGMDAIELGKTKNGEIYKTVQRMISEIAEKGILLAICSKNNEADAMEVLRNHSEMVLKPDDFIIKKINWNSKADNIREIAKSLNIGEDSIVFIDDSPFERELVRQHTDAEVPEFPGNIEDYIGFISEVDKKYFGRLKLTEEDLGKKRQYTENFARSEAKSGFASLESYIGSLNIRLTIEEYSRANLARIAQMTQKTNQFNFTTKRYSESDIERMASDGYRIFTGEASDRFGDYGVIILLILKPGTNNLDIDTFLMSCRAIGREIEHAFLYHVLRKFPETYTDVTGKYIPTAKNILVKDKYTELGFEKAGTEPDGIETYRLKTDHLKPNKCLMEIIDGKD